MAAVPAQGALVEGDARALEREGVAVGEYASNLAVGRLNDDGFGDIVVASGGDVETALGIDGLTFESPATNLVGAHAGLIRVAAVDVTGDGFDEVVHNRAVLQNNGTGLLSLGPTPEGTAGYNFHLADITNDGRPDIIYVPTSNAVVLLPGEGGGVFSTRLLTGIDESFSPYQ